MPTSTHDRPLVSGRVPAQTGILTIALIASLIGCGGPQRSSETNNVPTELAVPQASAAGGGVALDATLNRSAFAPADSLIATLRATNVSTGVVTYAAGDGACLLAGLFWIELPDLALDSGKEWSGPQGEIKDSVLRSLSEGITLRSPSQPDSGCDLVASPSKLNPGESVNAIGTWDGRLANGYPAPAGTYTVNVRFIVIAGPAGETAISIHLPIRVVRGEDVAAPGRALDVALVQPKVGAWLGRHPQVDWTRFDFAYKPSDRRYQLEIEATDGSILEVDVLDAGRGSAEVSTSG